MDDYAAACHSYKHKNVGRGFSLEDYLDTAYYICKTEVRFTTWTVVGNIKKTSYHTKRLVAIQRFDLKQAEVRFTTWTVDGNIKKTSYRTKKLVAIQRFDLKQRKGVIARPCKDRHELTNKLSISKFRKDHAGRHELYKLR